MACYHPLTGYYSKDVGASGKRGITFDRGASLSGVPIKLPCGQCVGCRLERSRQWAMRCMHEKRFHDFSEFVTLTYDNDTLPLNGTLVKRDLQLFNKRVRKKLGSFRFFACGEYGGLLGRPHYHSIMFGLNLPDKRYYKESKRGEKLYTSKILDDLWGLGLCVTGEVTFKSCAYVARYIMEKITGELSDDRYTVVDPSGVVVDICPEFNLCSRRPGIGRLYFDKYGKEVYAHDSVVVNGREVRPPRYYDSMLDRVDALRLSELKVKRRRKAMLFRVDNTPDRRRVRELVELKRLSLAKRNVV